MRFLFLPGEYHVDIPVGFYTEVVGLGHLPDAVHIIGNVHADASLPHNNATCTFWRAVEGLAVTPTGGTMQWAVSQAVPFRRMHVLGDLVLHQNHGWASGGWMSDSLIDGNTDSGSQQQWISRNSEWRSWTGSNWNMVFVGMVHAPDGDVARPRRTPRSPKLRSFARSPFSWSMRTATGACAFRRCAPTASVSPGAAEPRRHARFLFRVSTSHMPARTPRQPSMRNWHRASTCCSRPAFMNSREPIRVTRPDTVVLGLGFATLKPINGTAAMTTADADGIILAGLLFDAGETKSPVLLEVGPEGSKASHAQDPISLHDVFFRVGGAGVGRAGVNLRINSNDTIIDHTWIWRADHGAGVGWDSNLSANGLVVNGNNVTAYGLVRRASPGIPGAVERRERADLLLSIRDSLRSSRPGELYQRPGRQRLGLVQGCRSASLITKPGGWASTASFAIPMWRLRGRLRCRRSPTVRFHSMITVALDDKGEISNVIDDAGGPTSINPRVTPKLTSFP